MLDYSGQGKFKLQSLDLPEAAREMAGLLRAMIPEATSRSTIKFKTGMSGRIEADPAQIRQRYDRDGRLITNAAEVDDRARGSRS